MKNSTILLCIMTIMLIPVGTFAAVIHVPADQPTIQEGIDASVDGDTVLVADGTYTGDGNTNLTIEGKEIMVCSENGPIWCIIDCENINGGFSIKNSEGLNIIVSGFTVQNGNRNSGAGMYCLHSNPIISNCIFSNNFSVGGAGMQCLYSNTTIINCLFIGNSAYHGAGLDSSGGGITVKNCNFIGNYVITGGSDTGGGLECYLSTIAIDNCIFYSNLASEGSQIYVGGSEQEQSTLTMSFSDIENGQSGIYVAPFSSLIWGSGMIESNPIFVTGPYGDHYLSQIAAGQSLNSPCMDSGNDYSYNICFTEILGQTCLNEKSTRTDCFTDTLVVDMGFHYPSIQPTSTPYPTNTPIPTFSPTIAPTQTFIPTYTPVSTYTPPPTFTPTLLPSITATQAVTSTFTPYPTHTSLPTSTPYPTNTISATITPTALPTYTPNPTYTANPTYTPYPTPSCEILGTEIYMPRNTFSAGDECLCDIFLCNPTYSNYLDVPVFVILEIDGVYFFGPSFLDYDFFIKEVPVGVTGFNVIPLFDWPGNVGSGSATFYTAMTNAEVTDLFGELDIFEFSWY